MKLLFISLLFISLAAQAQRHQQLHEAAIVVDTHNDVLSTASMRGMKIDSDLTGKTHSDIQRLRKGGVDVQIFSVFCDERFGKDTAFRYANIEIDSLYAVVRRNPSRTMLVRSPRDLQHAVKQNKLACMLGVEGGHMIEDKLAYLDSFYKGGVRYMTLTWNNSTSWATSAWDETRKKDSLTHLGLNEFGKSVVRRMNTLGMLVDLSHVGEQTFWDAINTTTKPVIVSHSCVHALCPVPRNVKDDQIKAIGKNGGVIHLNFYSGFLDSNYNRNLSAFFARHQAEKDALLATGKVAWEVEEELMKTHAAEAEALRPPLSLLLDHLDYIVRLIGVNHVGLGSDFDGISSAPRELKDVTDLPKITEALLQRGYSTTDVRKILGGNFLRVFAANQQK
jgi:membrane dipeptidase